MDRQQRRDELLPILEREFKRRTSEEWEDRFESTGALFARVNTFSDILEHPHVVGAGMIRHVDHPTLGKVRQLGPPISMSGTPPRVEVPPPLLGQHTTEVLREAGFSEDEVDRPAQDRRGGYEEHGPRCQTRKPGPMTDQFEHRAIISGIGMSDIGRRLGRPSVLLALDASRQAIADAGLTPGDIDGLATMGDAPPNDVAQAVGLDLAWLGTSGREGSGGHLRFVVDACMAVATGLCKHVLVYRSVSMLSGELGAQAQAEWTWHLPYHEYAIPSVVARYARRHMYEYGTTREQLGAIAINGRRHAARNPKAVMREPITMDDYLTARWIAEPIGLLDCDLPRRRSRGLRVLRPPITQPTARPRRCASRPWDAHSSAIRAGTTARVIRPWPARMLPSKCGHELIFVRPTWTWLRSMTASHF